jgi:hypothetical protein
VTVEEALRWVTNVEEFKMRLRGITPGSAGASLAAAAAAAAAAATVNGAAPSGPTDIQRFGH